jgi:Zn-dependent metalloprotease
MLLVVPAGTTGAPHDPRARADSYLSENATAFGLQSGDLGGLRLVGTRSSLTADHVRYQQVMNGVPVFGATVSVAVPRDRSREPIVNSRYSSARASGGPITHTLAQSGAAAAAGLAGAVEDAAPAELVYFPTGDKTLAPAWKHLLRTTDPYGSWLVVIDATNGEVLLQRDLIAFDSGRVFDPNPAQTNGGSPPAPHCDSSFLETVMAAEYVNVTLNGIDAGQDKLKGQYVDLTASGIKGGYKPAGVADEPSRNYVYGCDDDRFEEVMAYHHVDRTQRKFQELGFTGPVAVLARPVPVHAHFMAGCNAFFDPLNRGLHFGDFDDFDFFFGCPFEPPRYDSGEDADVIVHEYGHAVQDDQIPGWGFGYPGGDQARSMGEGFGDWLAGVMNNNACIGEYIYFGEFACGGNPGLRWLQNTMSYPSGYNFCGFDFDGDTIVDDVEPHCGGQVWSGALWDLVEALGGGVPTQQSRDLALTLVLESHFYLDQAATFNDAAAAICMVDKILNGGANVPTITSSFAGRGISTGQCTTSDFPSFYLNIKHTWSGDLDVNVKVGLDVNSPLCTIDVADPDPQLAYPNAYIGYDVITACAGLLPPTVGQPWWLEVHDVAADDVGTILDFQVLLVGGVRCNSTDTPVPIPDLGAAVYAKVDCTSKVEPPPTPSPSPTVGPASFGNVDCDGAINSVDALKVLRHASGQAVTQTEPCPDIGVDTLPNGELQGDVDCSTAVNSVDALKLLRYASAQSVTQTEPCPDIGT